jgi:polysaccharide export outer membrane protein
MTIVGAGAQAVAMVGFVQVATAQIAPVPPLPPAAEASAKAAPEAHQQPAAQTAQQQPATPAAQQPAGQPQVKPGNGASAVPSVALPPGYVIGPEDVLAVLFWRDQEMSGEYVVRPDGQITLPLLSDIQAAGLTPEQLRDSLTKAASKLIEDPSVTVGVKAINSRKVFITGMVGKSGAYPLTSTMNVAQLISVAGGLHEFANSKNIMVVRTENGRQVAYKFNYKDFSKGRNLKQNIELKPGDQVIVP